MEKNLQKFISVVVTLLFLCENSWSCGVGSGVGGLGRNGYSDAINSLAVRKFVGARNTERSERPRELTFSAGDVISCNINGVAKHIMLASSSSTVIHVPGAGGRMRGNTAVREDSFDDATRSYSICAVTTKATDSFVCQKCNRRRPYSTEEIIRRARASVASYRGGSSVYDLLSCNCEHWVTYWRYGVGISFQMGDATALAFGRSTGASGSECPVRGNAACERLEMLRQEDFASTLLQTALCGG